MIWLLPRFRSWPIKSACFLSGLQEILRVQKLGKNSDSYRGETIDIRRVLDATRKAAAAGGWTTECFYTHSDFDWLALRRSGHAGGNRRLVHISAGIHGDEPAGPLAALKLIQENRWPGNLDILLLPCLNPLGFLLNQRTNPDGIDLNRDYRNPKSAEARTHIAWLAGQPRFDLYLCLHEDWESQGFYLYEQNPDAQPSLAEKIIRAVAPVCPVDLSTTIEDRPASGGIIRPVVSPQERPDWPEAFYHITYKTLLGYTLEAPSDFALGTRVNALAAAVTAALDGLSANPRG